MYITLTIPEFTQLQKLVVPISAGVTDADEYNVCRCVFCNEDVDRLQGHIWDNTDGEFPHDKDCPLLLVRKTVNDITRNVR